MHMRPVVSRVPLQNQRRRTPQPRKLRVQRRHHPRRRPRQHLPLQLRLHNRSKPLPRRRQFTRKQDHLRRQRRSNRVQPAAQILRLPAQRLYRRRIIIHCKVQQPGPRHSAVFLFTRLVVVAHRRARRSEHLPATRPPATARRPGWVQHHVPNSPASPPCPVIICPLLSTAVPMPSEIATSTALLTPSSLPDQISAITQAFASFSISTFSPSADSITPPLSSPAHPRCGASTSCCVTGSTLPGMLSPIPSNGFVGCISRIRSSADTSSGSARSTFDGSTIAFCDNSRLFMSTTAIVACSGRTSTASITMSSFSDSSVGRRPRGSRCVPPSTTHPSSISSSTIDDTVLGYSPDALASSTRATGCFARTSSRITSRLISRATSLEASLTYARSARRSACVVSCAAGCLPPFVPALLATLGSFPFKSADRLNSPNHQSQNSQRNLLTRSYTCGPGDTRMKALRRP